MVAHRTQLLVNSAASTTWRTHRVGNIRIASYSSGLIFGLAEVAEQQTRRRTRREDNGWFEKADPVDHLPSQAKVYILAVIVAAVPVFFYCAYHALSRADMNWLYLAGLTVLATCFPVRIALYKDRMWITLSDIFVFAAMLHFGPQVAVMIAVIEALTFNLRMVVKGGYRQVFNLAQITVVAYLMSQAVALLVETVAPIDVTQFGSVVVLFVVSLICGLLYFLLTSGFIAGAMALSNWQAFVPLWKRSLAWAPVTLSGVGLASILFLYLN